MVVCTIQLQMGSAGARGPFPLRIHGSHSLGDKSPPPAPNMPLLTHSILSGRQISRIDRHSIERTDSLEDQSSASGDSDDVYSNPSGVQLKDTLHNRRRRRNLGASIPILKSHSSKSLSKKSVKFADDLGKDLTRVCLFFEDDLDSWEPEPLPRSDYYNPSKKSDSDLLVEINQWQVNFNQPAADYMGFREKVENQNVALENVITKQKNDGFMGTIKVKNIAPQKDVFVRCSFNNWETFLDYPAKFYAKAADAAEIFDTFSFDIHIPVEAEERHVAEFCIGLRACGQEFWDSNKGANYQLITTYMKTKKATEKERDAYEIRNSNWGQFASWSDLDNRQPYY